MSALQGAVEAGAPVSRLHERQSFDPADFGVPSGREEEWRFTPLRRLRGLLADCDPDVVHAHGLRAAAAAALASLRFQGSLGASRLTLAAFREFPRRAQQQAARLPLCVQNG